MSVCSCALHDVQCYCSLRELSDHRVDLPTSRAQNFSGGKGEKPKKPSAKSERERTEPPPEPEIRGTQRKGFSKVLSILSSAFLELRAFLKVYFSKLIEIDLFGVFS